IYIMCIVAYVRTAGLRVWGVANLLLVPLMAWTLISSGSRAIFPVAVLLVAAVIAVIRTKARSLPDDR
ncbi:hypothetical protein DN536_38480, partial [Burkholderia multivorans]